MSRIPLQLWREAPGPCSGEVGPVARLPAGSGQAGSPSVQVSRAEESCLLSDLCPQRPSLRFPNRAPAAEGEGSTGRPGWRVCRTRNTGQLLMPDKRWGLGVWAAPRGCSCGGPAVWAPALAAAQGVISGTFPTPPSPSLRENKIK